jgi:acyl transferase domain-containing protein/acyl carrier protein/NADP-dependent 3-hydroxy acid dehydrogenase YdfG
MSTLPHSTPIAVVGLACRFPGGVASAQQYLQFLQGSGDGVIPTPEDRWSLDLFHDSDPDAAGRTDVQRGGYLQQDILDFEPSFFGISPREAGTLDPQQRLLLEVTWEAFEDAGQRAEALAGSRTGVFIGGFTLDNMIARFTDMDAIDNHVATSSSMTLLSNRISYTFDLRGPSMTLDTACSSSLVATHMACQAIARGECEMAVAGGVNVMLLPNYQIVMSKGHFLASDGRSKTFEADADGYGRGEGAGVVVLKRLDRAIEDGDVIHAVIRGTGVNQDGATQGIPMPNGDAQASLSAEVCEQAGVDPATIGYVEAHGTGTRAGDPIECRALASVYGAGRDVPLAVGSVKANIGHLEAAAGIAGLIKAILSVRERSVLPHRPIRALNPEIPFDALGIRVPQAVESWPTQGTARAAINSFGYGGTNAHVIVEEPPAVQRPAGTSTQGRQLFPLSARSTAGLAGTATDLLGRLDASTDLDALRGGLSHRRSHHAVRAAVLATDAAELREGLVALASDNDHPQVVTPTASADGLTWVFTGMGPQWWAMGQQLYRDEPTFQAALDRVDALYQAGSGRSILAEMLKPEAESRMTRNDVAQPANFLLQVGLVELLRERGPAPAAILGHSVGEVAAAWAAGCLSLEDAVTVSIHRSRLQQRAAGAGGMLAIGRGAADALGLIADEPSVVIAAYNAPDMVTLAGPIAALELVASRCEAEGVFAKFMRVEVPYHSPAMDPFHDEMLTALADITPGVPGIPLFSTALGRQVTEAIHDAAYWWTNTRGAVHLQPAVESALAEGCHLFLEVGPHPVLGGSIQAVARARGDQAAMLFCLRRKKDETLTLQRALAGAYVHGASLPWDRIAPETGVADLPRTVWQRERHWDETSRARATRVGHDDAVHPFAITRADGPEPAWGARLGSSLRAWIDDHRVDGAVVMPGAALLEACMGGTPVSEPVAMTDVSFHHALVMDAVATDLRVQPLGDEQLEVASRQEGGEWVRHAQARRLDATRLRTPAALDLDEMRARLAEEVDVVKLYDALSARGLDYGPCFRGIRALRRADGEALAELEVDVDTSRFRVHPALLDVAFQAIVALVDEGGNRPVIPVSARRLWCRGTAAGNRAVAHVRLSASDEARIYAGDVTLTDETGEVLLELRGLRCQQLAGEPRGSHWSHVRTWQPMGQDVERQPLTPESGRIALVLEGSETDPMGVEATVALASQLRELRHDGSTVTLLTRSACRVVPEDEVDPAQAALVGAARVAMNEHPELDLRLVDIPANTDAASIAALLDEGLPAAEELAVRDGAFYDLRIERLPSGALAREGSASSARLPMALEVTQPGRIDSLRFRESRRVAPASGEVEIEVAAASVNFKDVMKAMGMLSDVALHNTYLGRGLGLEAAGRVVRVGEGVKGLAVGDRVFTYHGGAIRSHICADARFVVPCPDTLDATNGACVFVFLTAWYSLMHAGRVRAGETVLIHSAAGGVGLAAVQIARSQGARVIATAGTPEKRALLASMGIEHVFDSRTLDFAEDVRAVTGDRGVDVVLNALAGPALRASLDLLGPGGRFLELGKVDIAEDRALGMLPFNRAISFHAIDLDRMATERPEWFAPVAREVMDAFAAGTLTPLPTETYRVDQVSEAFRALASGAQIGKVAIDLRAGEVECLPARRAPIGGGTWLVTGGLGGFGLRTAQWLAERGVDDLVLASRRGHATPEEAPTIAALRERGVTVREVSLDVTDATAVQDLVSSLRGGLRGVVHAATGLADAPLSELGAGTIRRAMAAKAVGAWNLHQATREVSLDHFWLYGSISAWVGNPGQAAYAAANAALDGLAQQRDRNGLPATAVSWGALAEAGIVARDESTRAHLRSLGLEAMPPTCALDVLERCLPLSPANLCVVDIDWDRWSRAVPGVGWMRLEALLGGAGEQSAGAGALLALAPEQRRAKVLEGLTQQIAAAFHTDAERIDTDRSLRDHGLDSIVAVEVSVAIAEAFGVDVSAMDLLAGRSITALAERIDRNLGERLEAAESDAEPGSDPTLAATELENAEGLRARILVTAPYDRLESLHIEGEHVVARVPIGEAPEDEVSTMAAAEVGRHLAILGSMACARQWPIARRHVWPVAEARLSFPEDAVVSVGTHLVARAECLVTDPRRGRASARAVLYTEDGVEVGRLDVDYHAIEVPSFEAMFAERIRPTAPLDGHDPYTQAGSFQPPEGRWDEGQFVRELPSVRVEDCAGHFPRLPALPVAVLGRHALRTVLDAARAENDAHDARGFVHRCDLITHRLVWAGEGVRLRATRTAPGRWTCAVQTQAGEAVAEFALELSLQSGQRDAMIAAE